MAKSKETKDKHFIKRPTYKGGLAAMREFIKKNLRYPKEALKEKIEGTVYVKYTVDYKGKVIEAKVISSLGHGCDEEAIRLVKKFEFEVPKNYKLRVQFHKNIQIHFRLPKAKPSPKSAAVSVKYNVTPTSKKKKAVSTSQKQSKKQGSYTYTIKF